MTEARLHMVGYADSDEEERAELAWQLADELRDVADVSQAAVGSPPGAKGDAVAWAELAVTLIGTVPSFVQAVQGWIGRHPDAAVTVEIGGDKLTLDAASPEERRRLLHAFLDRHGGG